METKYGGITFPLGDVSFADRIIAYDPAFSGGNVPSTTYQTPAGAIGAPDYSSTGTYVSLGAGGRLIVAFDDNVLLASGNSDPELHIFEIGPDVEDQFIEISADGVTWISVGKVDGSTDSIDKRIARTISGIAMIAAASAAPVQRNNKVTPNH